MLRDIFTYVVGTFIGTVLADAAIYAALRRLRPRTAERIAAAVRETVRSVIPADYGFVGEPTAAESKEILDDDHKNWLGFQKKIKEKADEASR